MPSFQKALRYWLRLGFISFGGPAGQIALMHRELVAERHWFSDAHFLNALNFCMILPGPEAQQLAIYLGWRLHGAKGGIAAGVLFVLPASLILFLLSWLYIAGGNAPWLSATFHGLLGTVIATVCEAALRLGARVLRTPALSCVAAASFVEIYALHASFPLIVGAAALIGFLSPQTHFPKPKSHVEAKGLGGVELPPVRPATSTRTLLVCGVGVALWWLPVFAIAHQLGWESTPAQQGLFFSKAAMVTFGGAYAVLPYVAQQAVDIYGWLTHPQMMSGLALAETTPGPLIMVLQFVGFLGGWNHPGTLSPLASATLGAAITSWVTFLPCFLFVFLGAPHVEKLGEQPRMSAAMTSITAAVVGVILSLGLRFSKHALWPSQGPLDTLVAVTAIGAFVAMRCFKVGLMPVIGTGALMGFAKHLFTS